MEGLLSGTEKLLWFIYRVFFTLIPAFIFLAISYIILQYFSAKSDPAFWDRLSEISQYKFYIILSIAFVLNVVIEGITNEYFDFGTHIKNKLYAKPIYSSIINKIDSDLRKEIGTNAPDDPLNGFNLTRLVVFQRLGQTSNYLWFLYVNYKIAIATSVYICLCLFLYLPIVIYTKLELWNQFGYTLFIIVQLLQLVLTSITCYFINRFVILYYNNRIIKGRIIVLSFLFGLIFALLSIWLPSSVGLFLFLICCNFMFFPIVYITAMLSYHQNKLRIKTTADILLHLRYGSVIIGTDWLKSSLSNIQKTESENAQNNKNSSSI